MELGNAESLSCPQYKCETIVDDGTILKVLTDDVVVRRFLQLLTDSFVQVSSFNMNILKKNYFQKSDVFSI